MFLPTLHHTYSVHRTSPHLLAEFRIFCTSSPESATSRSVLVSLLSVALPMQCDCTRCCSLDISTVCRPPFRVQIQAWTGARPRLDKGPDLESLYTCRISSSQRSSLHLDSRSEPRH